MVPLHQICTEKCKETVAEPGCFKTGARFCIPLRLHYNLGVNQCFSFVYKFPDGEKKLCAADPVAVPLDPILRNHFEFLRGYLKAFLNFNLTGTLVFMLN